MTDIKPCDAWAVVGPTDNSDHTIVAISIVSEDDAWNMAEKLGYLKWLGSNKHYRVQPVTITGRKG